MSGDDRYRRWPPRPGRPPRPPRWSAPWGFWRRLDPELRERIVEEMRRAYGHGLGHRHPWDRVIGEAMGRRPGWHHRVRWELRLHYGAHLHRRLFLWFGVAIFVSFVTTLIAAHAGRAWLAAHPWRSVVLFGVPALVLWSAAGRIARRLSRPLYELTRVAQAIGEGNFGARASLASLECSGFDEMAVLSRAFNDMAGRLEGQLTEQRELLAAVSHELRTPLARIRLLVEIARQGNHVPRNPQTGSASAAMRSVEPSSTSRDANHVPRNPQTGSEPPAMRSVEQSSTSRDANLQGEPSSIQTLDEIEREAIEIDTLVGELLASARLEFQALTKRPLEAGELGRRALERAGESADKLALDAPRIAFAGDPTLVARALANLIDNARRHGGGLERLNVRSDLATVVFEIFDRGPGFAAGEETRVFERFYRGENGGTHGSLGLGLALVRRIAEAHGGRVVAANRPGGGAVLALELAVDPPSAPAPSSRPPPAGG